MRPATILGALLGAGLLGGGIAYAAKKKFEGDEPYFLYVLQPGDTLGELALKFFGDAKKASVLTEANAALLSSIAASEKSIPAGARIRVPCVWVTVQKGDTLASVAQRVLGDGKRWRRILEANRNASSSRLQDPDKLAVGQRLAVPVELVPGQPAQRTAAMSSMGSDLDLLDAELVGCP